jgi:hypothetical protein
MLRRFSAGVGVLVALGTFSWSQEPAAESVTLRFARRDLTRIREQQQPAIAEAEALLTKIRGAEAAVAEMKAAQAQAVKTLGEIAAALPAAELAKKTSAEALATAEGALAAFEKESPDDSKGRDIFARVALEARPVAETTAAEVARLEQARAVAETQKAEADKQVPQLEAAFKALVPTKAPAEKALAAATKVVQTAEERVAKFTQTEPKADPKLIREVAKFTTNRPVMSVRFDAEAQVLLGGAQKNTLQRWDLFTGTATEWAGHKSWIERLEVLPDGRAVTGANEGKLIFWNSLAPQAEPARVIDAHKGFVRAVSLSPDRQLLATCGNDRVVKVWTVSDGALVAELKGHANHVYSAAFHPSGRYIFSGDLMGVVKQWEVGTWAHVRDLDAKPLHKYDETFKADCGGIRGMDFSPDGRWLACAGIGEVTNAFAGIGVPTVLIFDCETGAMAKLQKPAANFSGTCWAVKFHPSGEFLVACGGGGSGGTWFWKPTEEKSFHFLALPSVGYDLCLHPDGLRLAVALYDNSVRLYDMGPK